ncbi:PREDICTED: mavicyanin-like [Ipomoea nil]|uniref:mavicyanin-like n=1 Tax=Ipomoea nil TaxID=35883 RepID=UPI0009012C51|nr:PREDICTED: mavicyanin-like [Ipomoea nil]XP_019192033.1 PREDICTED: mavicyanin-like [Ipomoea nil]
MEKLLHILATALMILNLGLSCSARTYIVGDSSGWDISTDLDSWSFGKRFLVGDVLWFQYSSYHNVVEVAKEDFDGCTTSNVLSSNSTGNTTFPLTRPGQRLFLSGNRMYCLGGMKLQVNVESNQTMAPAPAPQAGGGDGGSAAALLPPSSKSNNPSAIVPGSSNHVKVDLLMTALLGILGLMGTVLGML